MPQFDPSTFASQLFWLLVAFVTLYLVVSRFAIPRIGEMLDKRQKTIEDDLDRARTLKAETEEAIATYEKALADARAKAHDILRAAQEDSAKKAEARSREVGARLAQQIKDGEDRITQARDAALAQVKDVAADAAAAITAKLIGVQADQPAVHGAVVDALKESAR